MYSRPYLFLKNFKNQDLWVKNFQIVAHFNILLWFLINLINDDAFVSAATSEARLMVHVAGFFMKTRLLALLQDNFIDLFRCAFLRKLSGRARNITAFCKPLLRPIKSAVLVDTDISAKPKYRPIISARPMYWSISITSEPRVKWPGYGQSHSEL